MRRTRPRLESAWIALLCGALGCASVGLRDPVTHDPAAIDPAYPPGLIETRFEIEGASLNAIVYQAQGAGPHPTVVLLHGMPGNERNLDLAHAIRRAGWSVVFFHYRGAWGSGGTFSFENVLEDVASVVATISETGWARAHRLDPERIALVGHSMGGFAALVSGAEIDRVSCVASLAGANLGAFAGALGDEEQRSGLITALDSFSGPLQTRGAEALVDELAAHAARFDTIQHAAALAPKPLLLVAGAVDRDTPPALHHAPLVAALEAAGASSLQTAVLDQADHSFSGQRVALARLVSRWLWHECIH